MCICVYAGFLSLFRIFLFLWLIFHRYTNSFFFCGGVLRGTEREKSNKQNDERVRKKVRESESERIIDDFFFLSTAPFTEFSSFSFHFQSFIFFCPSNYIMLFLFSFIFFSFFFLDTWLITWRSGAEFKFGCARSHADNHGFILDNELDAVS